MRGSCALLIWHTATPGQLECSGQPRAGTAFGLLFHRQRWVRLLHACLQAPPLTPPRLKSCHGKTLYTWDSACFRGVSVNILWSNSVSFLLHADKQEVAKAKWRAECLAVGRQRRLQHVADMRLLWVSSTGHHRSGAAVLIVVGAHYRPKIATTEDILLFTVKVGRLHVRHAPDIHSLMYENYLTSRGRKASFLPEGLPNLSCCRYLGNP